MQPHFSGSFYGMIHVADRIAEYFRDPAACRYPAEAVFIA